MINRLHVISLSAIGVMSFTAALIAPSPQSATPAPKSEPTKAAMMDTSEDRAILLRADDAGQFHLDARVNASPVQFLIDTGANMVAITEDEALRLGVAPSPDEFQPIMQTASGTGYGARVVLENVEIAGTQLRNVEAVVVQGLPLNLLGQSVLRQLGSVEMKGDTMVVKPRN